MPGAEDYDEFVNYASRPPETDAEVAGLARLANGGRVLELGVGTCRVAIPLAATGLDVHGVELDPEMIDVLRSKAGSERVEVHHGDMADMDVDGSFDLIYAVFGTLFMLPSQADQVRCFRRAAQPIRIRYSWPSELDLMAELVGLHLRARWSGWNGEP